MRDLKDWRWWLCLFVAFVAVRVHPFTAGLVAGMAGVMFYEHVVRAPK